LLSAKPLSLRRLTASEQFSSTLSANWLSKRWLAADVDLDTLATADALSAAALLSE